ncbi:RWD-domain-containing protein [Neolentinus lepideus HHB14362 ss-1]|uniref:RWD-domain-containing protein n=1 Tax=Neolentinus lepideus HHB14362 ss-1 TaxID=1314782 RepID=A0A165T6P6_9AGAM|nr:RWD-domain-containing protein [Neolentinus lepideus HHB14362 ss-1]
MASDALLEEFEVLESIYPTELSKLSERDIQIEVEPEEVEEEDDRLLFVLSVHYPDEYPDVLPDLSLQLAEGELEEQDIEALLNDLRTVGEENVGMAMTFSLVSHLRERMTVVVREKVELKRKGEVEKERLALEARIRGTPVTHESFLAWKKKFDQEMASRKAKEEEEKLKGMTPKEREEYKKFQTRPSGRQLFERDKTLATMDDSLAEEGTVSVDFSQYERRRDQDEEEEESLVEFSDSD